MNNRNKRSQTLLIPEIDTRYSQSCLKGHLYSKPQSIKGSLIFNIL